MSVFQKICDFKLHQFYKEKYMNFFGVLGILVNTCFLFFALESRSTASNDKAKALSDIKPAKKSDSKILINNH